MAEKGAINPVNRAAFIAEARKHWKPGTTFGQLQNAQTVVELIRSIDPDWGGPKTEGRFSQEDWNKLSQYLYIGSNANAVNNVLHGRGQKAQNLAEELELD